MFATTSLNGLIGHSALVVGLAASVFGALGLIVATVTGDARLLRSIGNYAWLALGGAVIAVVVMERALITRDFSLAYIQQVGSRDTPVLYNVTALWSALEGSILLWLLILAIYTAVIMHRNRRRLDTRPRTRRQYPQGHRGQHLDQHHCDGGDRPTVGHVHRRG